MVAGIHNAYKTGQSKIEAPVWQILGDNFDTEAEFINGSSEGEPSFPH